MIIFLVILLTVWYSKGTSTDFISEDNQNISLNLDAAATAKAPQAITRGPAFEVVFAIAGLIAVAYLVLRQRKKSN